jgi:hypothetical protein
VASDSLAPLGFLIEQGEREDNEGDPRDKGRSEDDVVSHFRPRSQAARDSRLARSSIASVLICLFVTMAQ